MDTISDVRIDRRCGAAPARTPDLASRSRSHGDDPQPRSGATLPPADSYRAGSADDFDRLYRSTYAALVRTVKAITGDQAAAEDVVQEAFVRAYQAWPLWVPRAPAESWIFRIALNQAFSRRRRETLRQAKEPIRRRDRSACPPELRDDLVWALRRLSPKLSAVVILHHQGYTNRELAAAFRVSERAVGLRLAAGRRRLRLDLRDWRPASDGDRCRQVADGLRQPATTPSWAPASGADGV